MLVRWSLLKRQRWLTPRQYEVCDNEGGLRRVERPVHFVERFLYLRRVSGVDRTRTPPKLSPLQAHKVAH